MIRIKQFLLLMLIVHTFLSMNGFGQTVSPNALLVVKAYNENNQPEACINFFQLLDKNNLSDEILRSVGNAYYLLNNYKEAANYYLKANELNSKIGNLELAKCYAMLLKPDFAVKYLEAYLNQSSRVTISELKGIKAFNNIDKTVEWNNLWTKDWFNENDLLFNDALYEFRIGNIEESKLKAKELLEKRPSYHQAYKLLGDINTIEDKLGDAVINLQMALDLKPDNQYYRYALSQVLLAFDKGKKALKEINQAIVIDSSEIDFYIHRVQVYLNIGEYEAAQIDLEKIISFNSSVRVYKIAGDTYFKNQDYLKALKFYNKCLEKESLNPDLYVARGDVYAITGAYEFAEKDFSMALDFYPVNGELYFKRSLVRINQKNYENACSDLHKSRNFGYVNSDEYIKRYCQ